MIHAFIFDMDGTLVDSELLYAEAIQQIIHENGYSYPYEKILHIVFGKASHNIYESLSQEFENLAPDLETFEREIRKHFLALQAQKDIRIPGSVALFKELAQTHPVCIVSGAPRAEIEYVVQLLQIQGILRFYLGSEDYHPGKPNPTCYLKAAEKLNVQPYECLVFEDSTAGVKAAKDAGMTCVALCRKEAPKQEISIADEILEDLSCFEKSKYLQ